MPYGPWGTVTGPNCKRCTISRLPRLPAINGQLLSTHPGPVSRGVDSQTDVPVIVEPVFPVLNVTFDNLPFVLCFHGYEISPEVLACFSGFRPRESVLVNGITGTCCWSHWSYTTKNWSQRELRIIFFETGYILRKKQRKRMLYKNYRPQRAPSIVSKLFGLISLTSVLFFIQF